MYYSIFEGIPHDGKLKTVEAFYNNLLPKAKQIDGFHGDAMFGSPHMDRRAVNIAQWDGAEAVSRWRNESSHLRAQKSGGASLYEAYRLRIGSDDAAQGQPRNYTLLFYRQSEQVEGKPAEDVTSILNDKDAAELKSSMRDSFVYQGQCTLWVSSWSTAESVQKFQETVEKKSGDKAVCVQVARDYTKDERSDAPHETPGEVNKSAL